ncbi:MAG: hypothetical protein RJA86_1255, partial [Pseudomonadota bacterium]
DVDAHFVGHDFHLIDQTNIVYGFSFMIDLMANRALASQPFISQTRCERGLV